MSDERPEWLGNFKTPEKMVEAHGHAERKIAELQDKISDYQDRIFSMQGFQLSEPQSTEPTEALEAPEPPSLLRDAYQRDPEGVTQWMTERLIEPSPELVPRPVVNPEPAYSLAAERQGYAKALMLGQGEAMRRLKLEAQTLTGSGGRPSPPSEDEQVIERIVAAGRGRYSGNYSW